MCGCCCMPFIDRLENWFYLLGFVKFVGLGANGSTYTLDLKNRENLILLDSSDIGFGAKSVLKKLSAIEKTLKRAFRKGARAVLICLIQKLFEKCPLRHFLTRAVSFLSPTESSSLKP